MSKRYRGKYLPVIFFIISSLVLIIGCSSDGNDPNNSATPSPTLTSTIRLTQQEVIAIAEEYANEVILPEEKSLLLERYKPPSSDEPVIKTVHDIQIFVKADGMYEIGNIKTWFVPSCISYEVTTKLKDDKVLDTSTYTCIPQGIYIDDATSTVIPQLSKVLNPIAFECSDKYTDDFGGVNIYFDLESITSYYWVESDVLEEICVCQYPGENEPECREKPSDHGAFKYTSEPSQDWAQAKDRILDSCEGFSSISSIVLSSEDAQYFEFNIGPTWDPDVKVEHLKRNMVRTGDSIPLRFNKYTGKIYEKRYMIDESILSQWQDTLITQHDAERHPHPVLDTWLIPPSELKAITSYDWIVSISDSGFSALVSRLINS